MVIDVKKVSAFAQTAGQGGILFRAVSDALRANQTVQVSFAGLPIVSTSFVNASFVELLSEMPFSEIMARVKIVHSSPQINDLIRHRMKDEALGLAAL